MRRHCLRGDCGVARDGASAKNVMLAAEYYGLKTRGFMLEPDRLRSNGLFSLITHMGFDRFVVVCGFQADKVDGNDPAYGRIRMDWEEFDRRFTGVTLMFEPKESFLPDGRRAFAS